MFRQFLPYLAVTCLFLSVQARAHGDDHRAHLARAAGPYERSLHAYAVSDIPLIDQDGNRTTLARLLASETPVMLNFIYTSCSSVCPLMTTAFAHARATIGDTDVNMISISIDPEYDTPARLRAYKSARGLRGDWHFLTGEPEAVTAAQRAFDAYRGGKMNHAAIAFLRARPGAPWLRLEGLTTPTQLVQEYRGLLHR